LPFLFASKHNESDNVNEMEGKRLIEKIKLRNILSFGDKGEEITLEPLNIIIGQNASGKSNLIDVLKLLNSLIDKSGIGYFIGRNGGISEWLWKGKKKSENAEIKVIVTNGMQFNNEYFLSFSEVGQRTYINEEKIKTSNETDYAIVDNRADFEIKNTSFEHSALMDSNLVFNPTSRYYVLPIADAFLNITTFTDLPTNRKSELRKPQLPDAPNDFLEDGGSNLALVLNDLEHRGDAKDKIVENLRKFNPRIKDYSIRILGGTVQLFIREEGLEKPISAMRLSDGTLRYLCLLAILCHPEPPPLICIEEPETGLHPDILPTIAELMIEASKRTQLIVTTHSDILVSAFSEIPEAVLVCEKDEDGTHFTRLEADKLKVWLDEYSLGETWLRGGIGGTRW
jgi:predicted ATPase